MSSKPFSAAEPVSATSSAVEAAADPRPFATPSADPPPLLVPPLVRDPTPDHPLAVAADPSAIVTTDAPALDAHGYDPADYDWVPVLRKQRVDGWTPQRQRAFIGYLADSGSVRGAADEVGMSTSSAYALRRSSNGAAFAAAWDAAIQQAAHVLVDEAFARALNGGSEPVFNRDGERVGSRHRRSDALMMFLLRKHFPDRYGDLHRDRAEPAVARSLPSVADTMPALAPVQPADPLALMSPDNADIALHCAHMLDGQLARWDVQDGSERKRAPEPVDHEFEAMLAEAKRAADPWGSAVADARQAETDELLRDLGGHARRPKAKRR